jgi:hypothetical protein
METSQNIQHLYDSTSSILQHIELELIPPTIQQLIPTTSSSSITITPTTSSSSIPTSTTMIKSIFIAKTQLKITINHARR